MPTIKRWVKAGRPLDDPAAMGEFLSYSDKTPAEEVGHSGDSSNDNISAPVDSEEELPIALDESFFDGVGILSAIDRLKKAERERAAAYFSALTKGPKILQNRFKEWLAIIDALRKVAKDEPGIRRSNDLTYDRAEVEAAVSQIFQALRASINNFPGRAIGKLAGLKDDEEKLDVLTRECEVLLRNLADTTIDAVKQMEASAVRSEESLKEDVDS